MEQSEADLKALENFIVGNAELEKLEAMLDRFNIFEAVGITWQEKHHSKFLAFLLDPNESHGMGDAFVKRLLQRAVMDAPNASVPVTPIELSLWDLGGMGVRREWHRIDIFLLDEREKLAVIIENKIGTGEHGDQLNRYYTAVKEEYPDHKLLALYLTPGGDEPSHPEYLPVDYRAVCGILDELAESRAAVAEPDARVLITHYTEMLRRHIVGDSEIAKLSRQIYQKHRRAIDLIFENISSSQEALRERFKEVLRDFIEEETRMRLWQDGRSKIKFEVREWNVPGNNLWLEFWNQPGSLELKAFVGPGQEEVRQTLFQMVRDNTEAFGTHRNLGAKFTNVFYRELLPQSMYENATDAEREAEIRKNWDDFLENDLPRIDAALKNEAWIWDSEESESPSRRSDRFTWGEGDVQILNRPDEESEEGEDER